MEFTIYRKSWRRGGDHIEKVGGVKQEGKTYLLNDCNMFCCLGMVDVQMGVQPRALFEVGSPDDVNTEEIPNKSILVKVLAWGDVETTKLSTEAMDINDDHRFTEEQREKKLTRIFAQRGHTLKFVNKLAPKSWRVA